MKVFMTGGTGFVGTYLAKRLISDGHTVAALIPETGHKALKMAGLSYLDGHPFCSKASA